MKTIFAALSLAVVLTAPAATAQAGDGFPPFGAWAYGSGSSYAIGHHRHGHHGLFGHHLRHPVAHFHHRHHFPRVAWSSYSYRPHFYSRSFYGGGWGGYRNVSIVATAPAYYLSYPRLVYRVSSYVPSYGLCPPVLPCPTYSTFYLPTCVGPSVDYSPYSNEVPTEYYYDYPSDLPPVTEESLPLGTARPAAPAPTAQVPGPGSVTGGLLTSTTPASHSVRKVISDRSAAVSFASDVADFQPFVEQPQSPQSLNDPIPQHMLAAADAIFQAGGYRQAAAAYAELNVRFGSTNLIFGRRFIAQVASGDIEQAAVILVSATAVGVQLERRDLPGGSLQTLFAQHPQALEASTERLAAHALERPEEAERLVMLGRWLDLVGDDERSAMFLQRAAELSQVTPTGPANSVELPSQVSPVEYISLE
ncbi:MAG: hypothetical protein KDA45_01635 [Planctomycetales bacterium]|nr:hypothetical protein [Planctomycetales bacterium]